MRSVLLMFVIFTILVLGCKLSEEDQKAPGEGAVKGPGAQPDEGKDKGKVVARVNRNPIHEKELGQRSVEYAIGDEILYDEALRQGLDKQYEYKVENYRMNLLIGLMKRDIYINKLKGYDVTQEEIMDYYNRNEFKYRKLKLVLISALDEKVAEEIHKRAINGEDLDKIAEEYKKKDISLTVKDLGFTDDYNDNFKTLQVNAVSDIKKIADANLIFKIIEVETEPSDKDRQLIKFAILNDLKAQALKDSIEQLKQKNNVEVEIVE